MLIFGGDVSNSCGGGGVSGGEIGDDGGVGMLGGNTGAGGLLLSDDDDDELGKTGGGGALPLSRDVFLCCTSSFCNVLVLINLYIKQLNILLVSFLEGLSLELLV